MKLENDPYFSIVIPMYNRERFIGRALESCLTQDFRKFEIVVVDDASTDGSTAAVQAYNDSRISLQRHQFNQGVNLARITGLNTAKGEWVVLLDSDDELCPGALGVIFRRIKELPDRIGILRFMCRTDSQKLSPHPPLKEEVWDYQDFIRFEDKPGSHECLVVIRRITKEKIFYSKPFLYETLFNLDLAKGFLTKTFPDVLRLYHQDAPDQNTKSNIGHTLKWAKILAQTDELVLQRHGGDILKWGPRYFIGILSETVTSNFLSGNRRKGLHYAIKCLAVRPFSLKIWVIILFGLLGPVPLAWAKAIRRKMTIKKM